MKNNKEELKKKIIYRASYRELLIKIGPEISDSISKLLKGRSYFENRDTFEILRRIKNPRVATLMLPYLSDEEVADQVILFVRDDQWDDQVADILLPITGKTYLLQFHSINKQHRSDKTITFGEREYSYVVDSQTGHEHSEIKAIGNV